MASAQSTDVREQLTRFAETFRVEHVQDSRVPTPLTPDAGHSVADSGIYALAVLLHNSVEETDLAAIRGIAELEQGKPLEDVAFMKVVKRVNRDIFVLSTCGKFNRVHAFMVQEESKLDPTRQGGAPLFLAMWPSGHITAMRLMPLANAEVRCCVVSATQYLTRPGPASGLTSHLSSRSPRSSNHAGSP